MTEAVLDALALTGRRTDHVVTRPGLPVPLHPAAAAAFAELRQAAGAEGIDLAAVSGFRSFTEQAAIWDAKLRGERPILDRHSRPVDRASLSEDEAIDAVLVWNALPGMSRHHWGTEVDVFDRATCPVPFTPELVTAEYEPGGPFERLGAWLDRHLPAHGFFRPYDVDRGGVQPEPWHLSYGPVSVPALGALTADVVAEAVRGGDIEAADAVVARLPELFDRYAANVARP